MSFDHINDPTAPGGRPNGAREAPKESEIPILGFTRSSSSRLPSESSRKCFNMGDFEMSTALKNAYAYEAAIRRKKRWH
ncbi:hypothetical protein SDJN02_15210, partial [Cucurbita argyrosperma subsp. argyrosperma]